MKVKALKFTKNHGFHGNKRFSRKKANFTENVMAVKSWIRLVPNYTMQSFLSRDEHAQRGVPTSLHSASNGWTDQHTKNTCKQGKQILAITKESIFSSFRQKNKKAYDRSIAGIASIVRWRNNIIMKSKLCRSGLVNIAVTLKYLLYLNNNLHKVTVTCTHSLVSCRVPYESRDS